MGKTHTKGNSEKVSRLSPKQQYRVRYLVPLPMHELFKNTEQPYEMVNIAELTPEIEYDSDYCVVKALKRDILANGMLQPLLVRRDKYSVELGNQRYRILKDLNITEVPVRFK